MPIESSYQPVDLNASQFDDRDRIVMGCAFASQNELGCSLEEQNYEKDLAARLRAEGVRDVYVQLPLNVIHGDFRTNYRIDLIADDALYELKTLNALLPEHDAQLLHYAMLLRISHCKLINFGPERVTGRLRVNAVSPNDRFNFRVDVTNFRPQCDDCRRMADFVETILEDWGAYLDFRLYRSAIIHHFGGEANILRRVPLVRGCQPIGDSAFCSYHQDVCFVVSGDGDRERRRIQLEKRLRLSPFRVMHWINFRRAEITLETIVES